MSEIEEVPTQTPHEARVEFAATMCKFMRALATSFPDCETTVDFATKADLLLNDPGDVLFTKVVEEWFAYVDTPLQSAKYRKPVQRILDRETPGATVCLFHAIAYGDTGTVFQYPCRVFDSLKLEAKMADAQFDAQSRGATLQYIYRLSGLVYRILERPLPIVPTREEIAEEIRKAKTAKPAKVTSNGGKQQERSDSQGFVHGLLSLCEHAHAIGVTDAKQLQSEIERDPTSFIAEWNENMQQRVNGTTLETVLQEGQYDQVAQFQMTGVCLRLRLDRLLFEVGNPQDQKTVHTLVTHTIMLSRIHESVPNEMRSAIETTARRIADGILAGDMSLDQLDLSAIGEEVLANCESEDLDSLASNLSGMLPMLSGQMQNMNVLSQQVQSLRQ
jgi:hypothetical protein